LSRAINVTKGNNEPGDIDVAAHKKATSNNAEIGGTTD